MMLAPTKSPARERQTPLDVYASLVDALYELQQSLFVGAVASSLSVLFTAWRVGSWLILGFAIGIVAVSVLRFVDIAAYWKVRPILRTREQIKQRERRYVFGAALHVALLGGWTVVCFWMTDDAFVRLFSFSVTLAYMIGISGRNFASDLLVTAQIVCAAVPLAAAMFIAGGFYYVISGLVLLPFFAGLRLISRRLRGTLLDAVIATRDVTELAMQFDTALNNMPHGLCMFDAQKKLVVTNRRLEDIFRLPSVATRKGETVREFLRDCVDAGTILRSEADRVALEFERRLAGTEAGAFELGTQDGRWLDLTFQPMANGGTVVLIEDITERRAAEARITHLARYDSLTGLPNRMSLRERMEAVLGGGTQNSAILFVDLDQFKQVNDTLGHPRGDALLRLVADRLRRLVRDTDVVARFGGDEFVVLQTPTSGPDEVAVLARRIVAALSETYDVEGHQVVIGASIGIALAPRDATGPDHLLKNADMALYWAKGEQRGTWRFFEPTMDIRAQARRSLELDLRNALANNAFEVYYQPLFDLKTMRVTTCEALLRWPHPLRGMIPPSEFIPVAEEMGLIVEIGNWVLHHACATCATWPGKVRVAVNLSANQFRRGSVVNVIREAIGAAGLDPSRLEIEITESVLFQDTRATQLVLRQLRDLGVRISLDDFGTGYSSLSYLHSLPLNKVKIDRSFLQGLEAGDRALILLRGVARLSAQLGLTVTVEGIETEEQLAIVAAEECIDEAQGYLFSVPIPTRQIRELLVRNSGKAAEMPPELALAEQKAG
jgi:diguanylate cyclase (GGDEF)-like protein